MAYLTLHVGLDTFRPVDEADPTEYKQHTEFWDLPSPTAQAVNNAKREGRRVVAVGTTTVRVLEQAAALAQAQGQSYVRPGSGWAARFHPAGAPVPCRGRYGDQLPPAPVNLAYAGVGFRGQGTCAGGVQGGSAGRVPFLQLWGLYGYSVRDSAGSESNPFPSVVYSDTVAAICVHAPEYLQRPMRPIGPRAVSLCAHRIV